jgi:hypothetical protein
MIIPEAQTSTGFPYAMLIACSGAWNNLVPPTSFVNSYTDPLTYFARPKSQILTWYFDSVEVAKYERDLVYNDQAGYCLVLCLCESGCDFHACILNHQEFAG